jgi:hypothetical protein
MDVEIWVEICVIVEYTDWVEVTVVVETEDLVLVADEMGLEIDGAGI